MGPFSFLGVGEVGSGSVVGGGDSLGDLVGDSLVGPVMAWICSWRLSLDGEGLASFSVD